MGQEEDPREHGWFAFSPSSLDELSPQRRELADRALAEYRSEPVLGTADVVVRGWERGQCEVRWGGESCVTVLDQLRLLDAAIAALEEAKSILRED